MNLPVWRQLGPSLIPKGQTYGDGPNSTPAVSGRSVGIVISPSNPQHLVLCSAAGGLWSSMDGGAHWRPLTDDQPVLSMGAIAAAPSSPNIVYAGTGEGDTFSPLGVGLLRSSDGGATWQHVPSAELSGTGVYDIAVDPGDPLTVWVATYTGLFVSRDGGVAWRQAQAVRTWDISINPNAAQEVFAATAAGLIRSANGGTTWSAVTLPGFPSGTAYDRLEVCHAPSNPDVVYVAGVRRGATGFWRRSTAGGAFTAETPPSLERRSDIAQAWYDWCFAVSPANPDLVYWGAVHLYRGSRSGLGWQWENISSRTLGHSIHPDQHHIAFDPSNPKTVYVCNDGGLFRSPDGGIAWESLNPGLAITEFEFLAQLEAEDTWLIGGTQDNGTLAEGGNGTWNQIALGDGGDCGADDDQKLCYHSYYGMWIERANALGPSAFDWTEVSPPFSGNYDALFYPPMEVCGKVIAKAGRSVFVSEDSGNNWAEIDLPPTAGTGVDVASALAIVGSEAILVGTEQGSDVPPHPCRERVGQCASREPPEPARRVYQRHLRSRLADPNHLGELLDLRRCSCLSFDERRTHLGQPDRQPAGHSRQCASRRSEEHSTRFRGDRPRRLSHAGRRCTLVGLQQWPAERPRRRPHSSRATAVAARGNSQPRGVGSRDLVVIERRATRGCGPPFHRI